MSDCVPINWDFPRDILVDILQRIPGETLARCSSLSKSWWAFINEESTLKRKIALERAWLDEPIKPIIHESQSDFTTFCYAKMKNFIALGGPDGLKVFDFSRKEFVFDCKGIDVVGSLSFMDEMLVVGNKTGDLCGLDISTWEKLFSISIFDSIIFSIADLGESMVVGGTEGDLQIYKKGVWVLDRSLQGHEGNVYCLLPQPGNLLISGSQDETIRVWNLVDNACLRVIRHNGGVRCMCVSGKLIFCGSTFGDLRSWDIKSGKRLQTFRGHTDSVTSLIIEGGRMFTGSFDGTIRIWDKTAGECLRTFYFLSDREVWESDRLDVVWVDDEELVAVGCGGEILEWNFSKGLGALSFLSFFAFVG